MSHIFQNAVDRAFENITKVCYILENVILAKNKDLTMAKKNYKNLPGAGCRLSASSKTIDSKLAGSFV